jgi:hypothetical protein
MYDEVKVTALTTVTVVVAGDKLERVVVPAQGLLYKGKC